MTWTGYLAELKLFIALIIYIHQGIKLEMEVPLKKLIFSGILVFKSENSTAQTKNFRGDQQIY